MERVIGYVRVSTEEQADSGLGLDAQRDAIAAACASRGWELARVAADEGLSGKSLETRPGIRAAIADVEAGQADGVVVAKLDRLSRSLLDFASLMERARDRGWSVVALDLGVDTSTPAGEMMANVMATFAQYERRLIGQRTRDALAQKKAHGFKLGRPRAIPDDVLGRIADERTGGATLQRIADGLNADSIPTAQGGRQWHASTVRAVLVLEGELEKQAAS